MLIILILLSAIAWAIIRIINAVNRNIFPYEYNEKMGLPSYDKVPFITTCDTIALIFLLLTVTATISRCTYL